MIGQTEFALTKASGAESEPTGKGPIMHPRIEYHAVVQSHVALQHAQEAGRAFCTLPHEQSCDWRDAHARISMMNGRKLRRQPGFADSKLCSVAAFWARHPQATADSCDEAQ